MEKPFIPEKKETLFDIENLHEEDLSNLENHLLKLAIICREVTVDVQTLGLSIIDPKKDIGGING